MLAQAVEKLIDNSAVAGFAVQSKQVITSWNEAASKLTGYAAREVLDRPCWEVFGGKDEAGRHLCRQGCRMILRSEFDGRVPPFNMLTGTKDGQELWVNVVSLVVPSPRNERMSLFHLLQRIDRPKQVENLAQQVLDVVDRFQAQLRELAGGPPASPAPEPSETKKLLPIEPLQCLTTREQEVLRLLLQGASTSTIAEQLVLSQATVRNHIQRILVKTGAHSRLEIASVVYAQVGMVEQLFQPRHHQ